MSTKPTTLACGVPGRIALSFLAVATALNVAAQPTPAPAGAPAADEDEIVVLSVFTVSEEAPDRYRAEDAISAVRVRAPLIDTPSSITVITRDMMDDLAPNRIFDATRYVAGVQEGRGIQFQDRMIIRGFETQNGARTVDNFLQSADADNVEESVVDRIEVTKGPNAILSPAGAPGGSVNIVTKSPTFTERRSLTATLGYFDAQKLTLDMGGPIASSKKFAYRLVGSWQDSRRYWSADAKLKGRALAPMFAWRINEKTQLTLKLVAADHWIYREPLLILDPSVTAATKKPFLAPGLSRKDLNGIQPWSHVDTESVDFFSVLTSALSKNLNLRVAANYRYYFEDSDQQFLSTPGLSSRYNPYTGELTQDYTWALNSTSGRYESTFSPFFNPFAIPNRGQIQATYRKTTNFQTDLAMTHKFGEVSSQTVAGIGYSKQEGEGRVKDPGTMPAINLDNPYVYAYPAYPANWTQVTGTSYRNVQVYLNQRFGFMDNRLYVMGGILRYDTRTTSRNLLTGAAPSVLDDSRNMWSASVLWKVRDNVSLYYSRSTNSSPVIANNLPLWRSGEQDEAGFKSEHFNRKLSFNGSWFKINQTNVTVPNPARQTDPTAPEQLVSDLGNHGIELELMGRVTDNLSATAVYANLKMRDALGRHVRGVADDNAAVLLNYRFTEGNVKGLAVNAGVSYSGRRAGDVPINYTALNVVGKTSFFLEPQYATVLGASYRWKEKYAFRLTIDNVFDKKNYISVAGGRVSGTGITMATGRNVRFSSTIFF
jgi:iron complex outermembrane recepter protein